MSQKMIDLGDIIGQSTVKVKFKNGKEVIVEDIPVELYLSLTEAADKESMGQLKFMVNFMATITGISSEEVKGYGMKELQRGFVLIQKFLFSDEGEETVVATPVAPAAEPGTDVPLAK